MGQHLDKAARGAYDAIVYIEGSEVVAEDADGRVIKNGVAGTDDIAVFNFAMSYVHSLEVGTLMISGHHYWSATPTIYDGIVLDGKNAIISLMSDITAFFVSSVSHVHCSGLKIIPYSSQTLPVIDLVSESSDVGRCFFHDIEISSSSPQSFSAIRLKGNSTETVHGLAFNLFNYVTAINCGNVIQLDGFGAASYVNMNRFQNFIAINCLRGIDVSYSAGYGSNGNTFSDWSVECGSRTTHGLYIPDSPAGVNGGNSFYDVGFVDLPATGLYFYVGANVADTIIIGGCLAYDPSYYVDAGVGTRIMDSRRTNLKDLYNGNIVTVIANGSGDYTNLSDALVATNGTESARKTIVVVGSTTDKIMIAKNYVDVIGMNAVVNIASDSASHAVTFFQNVTNSIWENIHVVRTGSPSSNWWACLDVWVDSDYVIFRNCTFENQMSTMTGATGLSHRSGNARFENCKFIGLGSLGRGITFTSEEAITSQFHSIEAYGLGAGVISDNDLCDATIYDSPTINSIVINSGEPKFVRCFSGSGVSTGIGSEQTIAHGLATIPTGCKAWIKYLVNGRYITEMIPYDATNVYPTVTSGLAYDWRIE